MKNSELTVFLVTSVVGIMGTMLVNASPIVDRRARSIWPFGGGSSSSEVIETTSEEPIVAGYDPAIAPALLQIKPDDRRIWKIHKYQGFDLRPIDLVPGEYFENSFNQASNSDNKFSGQGISNHQELSNYPIYPPLTQEDAIKAAYALNQQNLQSGYQNQHQEVSASEQSVQESYSNHHEVHTSHENVDQDYSNNQELSGNQQNTQQGYSNHQEVSANEGYSSEDQDTAENPLYSAPAIGNNEGTTEPVDLSFLDDLGGLAYFLPEPQEDETPTDQGNEFDAGTSSSAVVEETKDNQPGFLQSLLHRLTFGVLGSSASEVKGTAATLGEHQPIQQAPSAGFVESGGSHSFHLAAPTYHLPETQGSYIAYRLPANKPAGILNTAVSAVSSVTQQNVNSQDTQSTSYIFNNAGDEVSTDLGSAQLTAGLTFADSTSNNLGYTSVNPRGYQNGRPIHAFVEGPADQASQNLPALQYGAPFANSAPQNSPALQYGVPSINSSPQNTPALDYGAPSVNSAPQNSPALQYGVPSANSAPQNSPALQYDAPAVNSATQNSPALQYGAPTANSAPQNSPALQYGRPTATSAPQHSPALQYEAPTANSATQNSPALQYGAATADSATQNSPSEGVDADKQLNLSELSLVNLSPPLPYRSHGDFGRYSTNSERRISEQETEEIEEKDNFTEKTEATTPAVVIITPDAEIAKTYSRIRSYGAGNSTRYNFEESLKS